MSQMGFVADLQSVFATHSTHLPDEAHAGVAALEAAHSAPEPQLRQALVVVSQIGLPAAPHWLLTAHSTQAPDGAQTGAAALSIVQSLAEAQPRHTFDAESQMGAAAPLHEAAVHASGASDFASGGPSALASLPSAAPSGAVIATQRPFPSKVRSRLHV
jgi:hypothetical protein